MLQQDTIAALVTAVGESSVGIIRISGPEAVNIAGKLYKGKSNLHTAESHTIHYGYVYDEANDKKIDEALFLLMLGPRSFTGEDIVEVQCHGGMVVLKQTLQLILSLGARMAEQGEYSKRAFLNGRLDLAQAESIMDIVQAKTERGVDLALSQLQGTVSGMVKTLRADLLEMIAFIQADIDYPDDDIERLTAEQFINRAYTKKYHFCAAKCAEGKTYSRWIARSYCRKAKRRKIQSAECVIRTRTSDCYGYSRNDAGCDRGIYQFERDPFKNCRYGWHSGDR